MTAPCSLRIIFNIYIYFLTFYASAIQKQALYRNLKRGLVLALQPTDAPRPAHPAKLCFYCSCLSFQTHTPLFCSVQGFLWAAAVPEAINPFLTARKQICPSNFSHLIVLSVDHHEVPSIINGKRKAEWITTENKVLILMVEDARPSSPWQNRAALPQLSSWMLGLGQHPLRHACSELHIAEAQHNQNVRDREQHGWGGAQRDKGRTHSVIKSWHPSNRSSTALGRGTFPLPLLVCLSVSEDSAGTSRELQPLKIRRNSSTCSLSLGQ